MHLITQVFALKFNGFIRKMYLFVETFFKLATAVVISPSVPRGTDLLAHMSQFPFLFKLIYFYITH